jgi:periplasmic protein TonB
MVAALPHPQGSCTANDRLKERFAPVLWASIATATLLHFGLLQLGGFSVADWSRPAPGESVMLPPPEPALPAAPRELRPMSIPIPGAPVLPDLLNLPVLAELERFRLDPGPPLSPPTGLGAESGLFWAESAPRLLNRGEITRLMERQYPPVLRERGVQGTVVFQVLVGTDGRVAEARTLRSAHPAFEAPAERVLRRMRFEPATSRARPVPVWVELPVTFRLQ